MTIRHIPIYLSPLLLLGTLTFTLYDDLAIVEKQLAAAIMEKELAYNTLAHDMAINYELCNTVTIVEAKPAYEATE